MLKGRDAVGTKIARLVTFFNSWLPDPARRKRPVIANVAVGRELAGWAWS